MKISKRTLIITSLVTLVPMLVGICLWDQLPDVMATHFGFDNEPNGWTSKAFTVFGIPSYLCYYSLLPFIQHQRILARYFIIIH